MGDEAGTLFIARELLDGESLAGRLERWRLPLSEAMPIAFGMLAALSALHGRRLVHRDLKPSNVHHDLLAAQPFRRRRALAYRVGRARDASLTARVSCSRSYGLPTTSYTSSEVPASSCARFGLLLVRTNWQPFITSTLPKCSTNR